MKKLFLPYELALIAKEKKFDEPCLGHYHNVKNPEVDFWQSQNHRDCRNS